MHRRPLLLLAAGTAVVVVVCLRPFGGDSASQPPPPAPPPPPPAAAPALPPPPAAAPVAPHPAAGSPPVPSPASSPATADDHEHDDDPDGLVTGVEALDPAQLPDALRTAEQFAQLWSTPDPQWQGRLAELATPALAAALTEPVAREITGPATVLLDAPEWARIGVPSGLGTIVLDVVLVEGRWLVSALAFWVGEAP